MILTAVALAAFVAVNLNLLFGSSMAGQIEIGNRFSRLLVIGEAVIDGGRASHLCRCDCGAVKVVQASSLKSGNTQSCGCLALERQRDPANKFRTHGHASSGAVSRTYRSWSSMISRCSLDGDKPNPLYAGRGIRVCERWHSFENFLADMGERPSMKHSIDRVDPNGHYEPGNCRWATSSTQQRNRRNNRLNVDLVNEIRGRHEHGESIASIARRIGRPYITVYGVVSQRTWSDDSFGKAPK